MHFHFQGAFPYMVGGGALRMVICLLTLVGSVRAQDESIVTVDSVGNVGLHTSLALDSQGFPVISYWDFTNFDLKLAHCNDANCTGNDESLVTVDSGDDVGRYTSLVLDSQGFPVISYYDFPNGALKLAHCNDANCTGNDESLVTVDSEGFVGLHTSLALDSQGFPVISYYDGANADLKLAHCNDANCTGNDESLVTVDSGGFVGVHTSLALDSQGFPVISYYDNTNRALKLVHCNDANCAGNDESIVTVDSGGDVGQYTSLALDSQGFPVISYWDFTNFALKLAHCNDVNCAGNDESLVTVDSGGAVGQFTSLALDSQGFPVISYWDNTNGDLKLAHCNDANCTGNDESLVTVDSGDDVGRYTSLVLDSQGFPVISYWDITNGDLKLAHCNDANCAPPLLDPCETAVPTLGCTVNGVPNQLCLGTAGDDTIIGTNGPDVILGGEGDDVLRGRDGDDLLCGQAGEDNLFGASGDDTLIGGSEDDNLTGNAGDDVLEGGSGDDVLIGGGGQDVLDGGAGNDKLLGNEEVDMLLGGSEDDILNGGGEDDTLDGEDGTDSLTGGPGVDTCLNGEKLTSCEL